ncbi:DUF6266 family protein [Desertivirga brevis]|uniref:DUF6266 family protein n=1 Tax=Desertivirga brevis TaxID=2810310 RepID=UPI001A973703|nr:DUF6266 family protein [Pedobacter sp. SYSU D00873]
MGKFSNGIFGNFYGKVGNVVGSNWRGVDYLRSLPRMTKNRVATQGQLEQQAKFGLITAFLSSLRPFIEVGYKKLAVKQTAYNVAVADNVKNAITGNYPDYDIDPSALSFSRGILPLPLDPAVAAAAERHVSFSWTDNSKKGKALETDKVSVLLVNQVDEESEYSLGTVTRADGAIDVTVPAGWVGKEVDCYLFIASANGKEVSNTFYGGKVTILE